MTPLYGHRRQSDAHRAGCGTASRTTDVHDRVNFAIQENHDIVDKANKIIRQSLNMDQTSSVLEYLSIYLSRIIMCEKAAAFLGQSFDLTINGSPVNNRP